MILEYFILDYRLKLISPILRYFNRRVGFLLYYLKNFTPKPTVNSILSYGSSSLHYQGKNKVNADFFSKPLINPFGYSNIEVEMHNMPHFISLVEFQSKRNSAVVLDSRHQDEFRVGHVPGAINIPLNKHFSDWVKKLFPNKNQAFILITELGKEEESYVALQNAGYENVSGALEGGYQEWRKENPIAHVQTINAVDLKEAMGNNKSVILDVRQSQEHENSHLKHAHFAPLDTFLQHIDELDTQKSYFVYCESGYRSVIACSFLLNRGYTNIIDIDGGFEALKNARFPKVTNN